MSDEHKDVLQSGSVPYDAAVKAFGFKASWRAANLMRQRLMSGPVQVRVTRRRGWAWSAKASQAPQAR